MPRIRHTSYGDPPKQAVEFKCPGCGDMHTLTVRPHLNASGSGWTFNGDLERPTIDPSINATCGPITDPEHRVNAKGWNAAGMKICHSFVRAGRIQFLPDCTHSLAGTTVDLPELEP